MPTKTFLNLSEEKQNRIITASVKEFSRVPLEKTSINKIIKDAGISRGSFYMYFEDKYDLTMYLFETTRKYIEDISNQVGISVSGKLDEFIIKLHHILYQYYTNEEYRKFIFNLISHFQRTDHIDGKYLKGTRPLYKELQKIYEMIDKDQFLNKNKEYIVSVIELSLNSLRSIMFKTIINNLSEYESTKMLKCQLKILKQGYGRKK